MTNRTSYATLLYNTYKKALKSWAKTDKYSRFFIISGTCNLGLPLCKNIIRKQLVGRRQTFAIHVLLQNSIFSQCICASSVQ